MSEIFDAVRYVIEQSGYASKLTSGVVITGGSCHLENLIQLAGALLGQKIRLAAPQGSIDGASVDEAFDVYASTAVGLVLETLDPLLSHAVEFKKETAQPAAKPADNSLFEEEDEPEEDDRPSARQERERRREEERKAKELRKQQEAQRKKEEAERKAREKAEKAKTRKNEPSFFDLLFSDNDNA